MTSGQPWIKIVLATLLAAGTTLWGWFGWLVLAWVGCMAIDYLSGSVAAIRAHEWNSEQAKAGLAKKAGMILAALAAVLLDVLIALVLRGTHIRLPWNYTVLVSPLVIVWYALTELGSIIENAVKLGAPVPEWLIRILKISKDAVNNTGDDLTK